LDAGRLSKGEQILGVSAIVLFISSFVEQWAKASAEGFGSVKANAWDGYGFLVKLGLILALVAAGLVIARLAGANFKLPWPLGLVYVGIGALTTLLMLLGVLTGPDDEGADAIPGIDIDRGFLLFVAVILGAAMTYGGYLHMQSEGSTTTPTEPPPPAA
jgi:hypothetical protein